MNRTKEAKMEKRPEAAAGFAALHDVDVQQPIAWRRGFRHRRGGNGFRRSRALRVLVLGFLGFIVYAQWRQIQPVEEDVSSASAKAPTLNITQLRSNAATCVKLRQKPADPPGPGREKNARYIEGGRPTLIKNATVWTGEPTEGTLPDDARRGAGFEWIRDVDILLRNGLIVEVGPSGSIRSTQDTITYDARGRPLTAGIIDMHSHAGIDALPGLRGNDDTNEMSSDITPYVRSIDGIKPLDPQIRVIKSGGVTTSLVLPGSANNIGGEAYVIKHAVGRQDGRPELSAVDMLADPDRNWRYMKMACGENAKNVYGKPGEKGPTSRLGESWEFRHAFEQAAELVRAQDDWCDAADARGVETMQTYLPQELRWESLGAVLRGQVHVNTHCYTIPDLEAMVDHTNEFKFPVRAFHHAHQTFLVPEILKRVYGGVYPASALFADNMWYKDEANTASEFAGKILFDAGLDSVYVSDNPVINAQHVVFEAAKAYGYGLPYHAALASVTSTPAKYLGLGNRLGKIKAGFDADVVVWDSDPLSVGAAPVQVWIDGTAQFEDPVELDKPVNELIKPDLNLAHVPGKDHQVEDVVFTGITNLILSTIDGETHTGQINMAVKNGKVACVGSCAAHLSSPGVKTIKLRNAHVTDPFIAVGSSIGLNAIDAESSTDNGRNPAGTFTRAVDGLALDNQKVHAANKYGVTRAVSAPKLSGQFTHHGVSVGFRTGAKNSLEKGAIWSDDVAVHYTLSEDGKSDKTPSISSAVGSLRSALLDAVDAVGEKGDKGTPSSDRFTERAYLKKVVTGETPLVLTVHSADTIAAILRVKNEVEKAAVASLDKASIDKGNSRIRLIILGGAESHLIASELAEAKVAGVILAPLQSYCTVWEQRRCLTGAPLTNGTAVDILHAAGVPVGIGLEEDWLVRDLGLLAGIAGRNSGGNIGRKEALGFIGAGIERMLGVKRLENQGGFVVWEGDPLEVGARVKGVSDGSGSVTIFE
ncbi:hypothetical protein MCOR14_005243 [Pyricularia oryzae]|uniref:Amidohydrolase 3 domain-containing protein n=1 Tax=Pyricularia oryzae TaxID=318829 RepID=A0A4P7MXJ3_PYROR|nr:hypothetical protein MCOR11_010772 [Pyricularia oryzae]KAI6636442.1 hypothetical protein MCOR14_005243 [Pyricularia oryzae]QBZ54778.1 hypothetical protein PoMZ_10487 [Pyricularia oryzae]